MGEETAEFEDGKSRPSEGSFEPASDGPCRDHHAGRPQPGMAYRQEYYKGQAEDNGEVLSIDEMAEVPAATSTTCC